MKKTILLALLACLCSIGYSGMGTSRDPTKVKKSGDTMTGALYNSSSVVAGVNTAGESVPKAPLTIYNDGQDWTQTSIYLQNTWGGYSIYHWGIRVDRYGMLQFGHNDADKIFFNTDGYIGTTGDINAGGHLREGGDLIYNTYAKRASTGSFTGGNDFQGSTTFYGTVNASKIIWTDGTVQVSSPLAGGGAGDAVLAARIWYS